MRMMKEQKGYNNNLIKQRNRGMVLHQVVINNGISRSEMAKRCGLTKMSISNIVNEFIEKDIVVETFQNVVKKPGRKSLLTRLSPGAKKIVGLLIHRKYISAALCDCQLNVIRAETVWMTECTEELLYERAFKLVDKMMEGNQILGIGIGAIGPVNTEENIILSPPDFYGIQNVHIVEKFQERYALPVYLDYHYNCAAMAERYFGAGKVHRNFILLGVGQMNEVGISIVVGGKIYNRMTGLSSEFGHTLVEYNGRPCFCGRKGCLGGYMEFGSDEETWKSVEILTAALSGICDLLLPDAVIIRDERPCLGKKHLEWMEQELNHKGVICQYHQIKVCRAYRSQDLEAAGCAVNVLSHVFSGEVEL